MPGMDDLVAWLRQQIDLDEVWASRLPPDDGPDVATIYNGEEWVPAPARSKMLREVEAKRRIIDEAAGYSPELAAGDNGEWAFDLVLRLLAHPYSDRPGYREEWKP